MNNSQWLTEWDRMETLIAVSSRRVQKGTNPARAHPPKRKPGGVRRAWSWCALSSLAWQWFLDLLSGHRCVQQLDGVLGTACALLFLNVREETSFISVFIIIIKKSPMLPIQCCSSASYKMRTSRSGRCQDYRAPGLQPSPSKCLGRCLLLQQ